ncbi:2,3-butanediol dehydrogenase [Natrarchaeobius halalkaliphilus]|uniref:2,3-butanediol dehydrogenase n=1 Tax=Natrarchaeobius halalkaliphilus TaxID=1679091 RepID=A0A3N6LNN7_9EURY|nr:2,3-butanediol dehydrogenase [Natrarchaeobius halalkaliphilus]RQG87787.1 2,3-butanediol dehydrogenase [Natrarchaeobius halalkaliphilus]
MKTARYHGPHDIRLEETAPPDVGPQDVRLEVDSCGICGTDLHEYRDGPIFVPDEPHPVTGVTAPIVLGHEFSGVVSETGTDVSRISRGDRVVVHPNVPCLDCHYCEEGTYRRCNASVAIGLQTETGGFAEQAVVSERQIHRLPDAVSLSAGALVEPLAVGLHAVRRSDLRTGDTAAVFGAGPVGLAVAWAAANAGAKRVFVSEPATVRRRCALEVGADTVADPVETDPVDVIRSGTIDGVDVAFEFAGREETIDDAIRSTKRGGTIVVGSVWNRQPGVDLNEVVGAERELRGTNCYGFPPRSFRTEFDAVINSLANGDVDPDTFITERIALESVVDAGFERLLEQGTDHVKILVEP